jgi:hypothetical protein
MPIRGSSIAHLMAARSTSRLVLKGALLALVLAVPVLLIVPVCDAGERAVDTVQPEKTRPDRDRCKRGEGRTPAKGCPDGGERLPQDKARSPLDTIPPLSPLVA